MNRFSSTLIVPLIAALLAVLCGLIFLNNGAQTADGVPVLALDDSYIHLQYAQQASQGHFLQYNTGDSPTTGATSLLYMALLAFGFSLGLDAGTIPGAILLFGLVSFALTAALLADLGRRAADSVRGERDPDSAWIAGLLTGSLFATSGWMAWAFFSGMETGLLVMLVAGTLWASLARYAGWMAFFVSLAVLTRPEALLLAIIVLLAEWRLLDPAETNDHRRRFWWALVPVGIGLLPFVLNWLLTGSLSAAGLQAKSWLSLVPFYADRVIGAVLGTLAEIFVLLFGGPASDGMWHALPLVQVIALVGVSMLAMRGRIPARRFALVCVGWVILGAGATATLQTATWHHYRYQMPLYVALLALAGLGLPQLVNAFFGRLGQNNPFFTRIALAAIVVVWGAFTLTSFGDAYALDTTTVLTQQMVLADCLHEQTPDDAWIAVHDVGVMRFLGGRRTIDVVGLTTSGMAQVNHNGPGAIYERLEVLQPDYYAVYPDAAPPYFGIEATADLLGQERCRVEVDPFSVYTSAAGTQVVAQPDWSAAPLAGSPQQPGILAQIEGWSLVDQIDVADLEDEAAHDYTWWHEGAPEGHPTDARWNTYREGGIALADGGRIVTGGESFTLQTRPGEWTLLVARLHQVDDMTLRVEIDGLDVGAWRLPALPGEWLESAFLISPDFIRNQNTRVRLTVEDASPDATYSAFHYWAYQGTPEPLPPPPLTVSEARFADVVTLRGFDLPSPIYTPGDTLDLTLHWEAISPPQADHKVFVHLVDPENDTEAGIIAQLDSAPHEGTYPFWVWRSRETVSDTVMLHIPSDAPPGEYIVLVGIYDAATDERLPIIGGEDFGADRLVLGTITVR